MALDDSVIIVTGGASGMGKAMVEAFLEEGADVVCVDVNEERLDRLAERWEDAPNDLLALQADVTSWDAVQGFVDRTLDEFGRIDAAVNTAALNQLTLTRGGPRKPIAELPVEHWDRVIRTNLRGPFLVSRAVLPEMLSAGSGRLIFFTSTMGKEGRPRYAPYVVTKFAIEGFCQCLSPELEGTGVECIRLRPPDGSVDSETRDFLDDDERRDRHPPEVITGAALGLVGGEGENGGSYLATEDGAGFISDPLYG